MWEGVKNTRNSEKERWEILALKLGVGLIDGAEARSMKGYTF
jgi:hypothetical protein